MRRILTAVRVFFAALFSGERSRQLAAVLEGGPAATTAVGQPAAPKAKAPPPARSDALALLDTLQREARLIDFVKEPLEGYSDAQIGAAARDVHRDCGKVLERMFAFKPLLTDAEGAEVEVPAGFDPGRYRLVGNVTGEPPFRGRMMHHGWEAARCELPGWSGTEIAARVVAPVEVEL